MMMERMRQQVVEFTNRYPLVGPIVWFLSLQNLVVQPLVARAWPQPYNWATNLISDLGNTACGAYSGRYVCSPLYHQMNASFITLGVTMMIGAALIYQMFERTRGSLIGFSLMSLSGLGTALVGAFPENTIGSLHFIGALLALAVGNISLLVLAASLRKVRPIYRVYTALSGVLSLTAFGLFVAGQNLGLGQGGIERVAGYPLTIWLTLFGAYMTAVRMRARNRS